MNDSASGLLRALCFHDAWSYPPTRSELCTSFDQGTSCQTSVSGVKNVWTELHGLLAGRRVIERRGRLVFPGRESLIDEHERRAVWMPRKWRTARRVARWLVCWSDVRAILLCNSAALMHARDFSDLDFFVLARSGRVWQIRGWSALPFKLLAARPGALHGGRDAACLSFFLDDAHLDVSRFMLPRDDPYFRHWFLSLQPMYDDGVLQELWDQNAFVRSRHPCARRWLVNPDVSVRAPAWRWPAPRWTEAAARLLQTRLLAPPLRALMNRDTRVVLDEHALKLHAHDGREAFRERYIRTCAQYGVEA